MSSDGDSRATRGRRPASTAEAVEQSSIELLLERGYDAVSVDEMAAAAGIGRSTFFRYFGTKAAVVWWGFDKALAELETSLRTADPDLDIMVAIRAAVAASVRAGVDARGVWWERFVLLDTVPALRAEAVDRWERWTGQIAQFVAGRMGLDGGHPFPVAIAAAHQGVYLASLRNWQGRPGDPEAMLEQMLDSFEVVGDALRGLLTPPAGS
ncbi:acyl-CoA-like ligand-binding transcription factor [Nocardia alni]|uniref:acyl-CoA-like ligand-binding transcription factor n=1 Tax=Nocardia alni TaxID=2815723 RepID=UPI001C23708E|nr:TetR family transcriptional regulator [Nocardia alni]